MKIGILSDSHGRCDRVSKAVDLFAREGVEAIVHCGDIGSVPCLQAICSGPAAAYAVAGNVDRRVDRLELAARTHGARFSRRTVVVPVGAKAFLIATHGQQDDLLDEIISGGEFAYVCHGHTHRVRDDRVGGVRVVNPGALYHCRDPRHPMVAVLDTDADVLERFGVE